MFPSYIEDWNNPSSTLIKKYESDLRVDFKGSGGQIYLFGADRPDLMRGPNPFGVVLDEYSVMKPEVWESIIQPIMRANPQAWCWFLFTPRGKNHAHKVFQFGQRGDDEWKSWELNAEQSGIFNAKQLENARRDMSADTFEQELMCKFLEGEGAVFRNVRGAATAMPQKPIANHIYVMGVDLAKVQDYTVIAVYDRATNAQVYQERFNKIEWPFQKAKILATAQHYNNALVCIDATGIGDPIADDLARSGLAIEPYKLSEQSKKELIEKLSIWIAQRRCSFIPMEETLFELDNYTYEISSMGKVRYSAPNGFNDDIVIAHALAVWLLQPLYASISQQKVSPIKQLYIERQKSYEESEYDYEPL